MVPPVDRARQQRAPKVPRHRCRYRALKEDPDVRTVTGPGSFQGMSDSQAVTGRGHRSDVVQPPRLVEVDGEEGCGLVELHRVDPQDGTTLEMVPDRLVAEWKTVVEVHRLSADSANTGSEYVNRYWPGRLERSTVDLIARRSSGARWISSMRSVPS